MRYSERLGDITDAQLRAALDRAGLGRLRSAKPAPGGLFGQNILVESSAGSFVLRGAPHADWQFPKERFFSRLVHDQGTAPVPWPYEIEESTDILGTPFAFMPALPGAAGEGAFGGNHGAARDPAFAYAAGIALGRLHKTVVPFCGTYELESDALVRCGTQHADYIQRAIELIVVHCRDASRATTADDVAWIHSVGTAARDALLEPFEPTITHLDYAPGNILCNAKEDRCEVTGIVDWMTAEAGDGEADLSRFLTLSLGHPEATRTFLDAYHSLQPVRAGFEQRFPAYMLLERLLIWEYGQRNRVWFEPGTHFREWAEPFVEMLSGR